MATMLETQRLSKSFGAVSAAADINLSIEAGEIVGLIGANGAGKTTFVNIVTGYLKPTAGRVSLAGRDITGLPPRAITHLGVSRSFQMPQLMDNLTARDNILVAFGVAPGTRLTLWRPLARDDTLAKSEAHLRHYDIEAYADQKAGALPQGVRKLLDIAMAMVSAPKLVLLDEPTSGISVDEKFAVMETLMRALPEQGVTVLFVEHDMEIVERYAHRVLAFYDGRIIADDAPGRVFANPDVKTFVLGTPVEPGEVADASNP